MSIEDSFSGTEIALIGMAGRFPKAPSIAAFWKHLLEGQEAFQVYSDEDLIQAGIPTGLLDHPSFVKAGMPLDDISGFDPAFFGYTPKEAAMMDPQHRLLLEVAWESLENSGYIPEKTDAVIAVYAGCGTSHYDKLLLQNREIMKEFAGFEMGLAVNPTHLATRIAYKLNLTGPAISLATACSTSLTAVHVACQSLLNLEADMALAGGVSLKIPQKGGYLYHPDGILSPDGHCRAFDADANGTAGGNGAAMVVLRRLEDALEANDHIYAVIKGSALNNDGHQKAGYVAPSVAGQASVIAEALSVAEVDPATIGYVEAHGTGTPVGDPIEVTALKRAFEPSGTAKTCALSSVKTHIGHLDAAAGVTGLIKAALSVKHGQIPANLHYQAPNPLLELDHSPFYIPNQTVPWPAQPHPRRAGVSSFGIGGTNAHAVLEQAPTASRKTNSPHPQLFLFSGKSPTALETLINSTQDYLQKHPQNLADVAFTLAQGRADFPFRRFAIAQDKKAGLQLTLVQDPKQATSGDVIFLLSGQGGEYTGMGHVFYQQFSHFRNIIDTLAATCDHQLEGSLLSCFQTESPSTDAFANLPLKNATLFALSYGLGSLFMHWGVKPVSMLGLSLGEYVAASLSGTMSPTAALELVIARAKLVEALPEAKVLSVAAPPESLTLPPNVDLTIRSAPDLCVVAGPKADVSAYQQTLEAQGVTCMPVAMDRGFHSTMTMGLKPAMTELSQAKPFQQQPNIPYFSNVTGSLFSQENHTDPDYWFKHLSSPVAFSDSVGALPTSAPTTFIELGPGAVLSKLVQRQRCEGDLYLSSLPKASEKQNSYLHFLNCLGRLWASGTVIRWDRFFEDQQVGRLPLPTTPFERQSYWVHPDKDPHTAQDVRTWYFQPQWQQTPLSRESQQLNDQSWLVLDSEWSGVSEQHSAWLQEFLKTCEPSVQAHVLPSKDNLEATFQEHGPFHRILVFTSFAQERSLEQWVDASILTLSTLCQLQQKLYADRPLALTCITLEAVDVSGIEPCQPEARLLSSALQSASVELPHLKQLHIDLSQTSLANIKASVPQVHRELAGENGVVAVALRGKRRWTPCFVPHVLDPSHTIRKFRVGGVYLITGGLGRIGSCIAQALATHHKARLVLISRTPKDQVEASPKWQQMVQAIETASGQVCYHQVDCANLEAMTQLRDQISPQWGAVDGIFHAAAQTKGPTLNTSFVAQTKALLDEQLHAKYGATRVLYEVFSQTSLEFCALFSSNAAILGRPGSTAYAAANSVMDGLAHHYANLGFPAISINWDGWEVSQSQPLASPLLMDAMTGPKALADLLQFYPGEQIVVSKQPFAPRVAQWLFKQKPHSSIQAPDLPQHQQDVSKEMRTPETPLQQQLHDIWCAILGRPSIDIEASFFDSGGHSLMGTQVMSRVRDHFSVDQPVRQLYEHPTISSFSDWLETQLQQPAQAATPEIEASPSRVEDVSLGDLEAELENLSEEELQELLS